MRTPHIFTSHTSSKLQCCCSVPFTLRQKSRNDNLLQLFKEQNTPLPNATIFLSACSRLSPDQQQALLTQVKFQQTQLYLRLCADNHPRSKKGRRNIIRTLKSNSQSQQSNINMCRGTLVTWTQCHHFKTIFERCNRANSTNRNCPPPHFPTGRVRREGRCPKCGGNPRL